MRGLRTLGGFLAGAVLLSAQPVLAADDWPSERITLIVSYSAGGATDILARQVADLLSEELDQTVTVENRPGAGGTLGTALAAAAEPDGYTLFVGQVSSHGIAPAVYANLQYDPVQDFAPVTLLMSIPNVMVVREDSPATTVEEFVDLAREEGVTFGSSGVGSSIHLSGEMFAARTGVDLTHVPFRGSAEAVPALLSGDVDVMFDNLPSALPHIESGALRALAVTTPVRAAALPGVETLSESGVPGLEDFAAGSWFGIMVQDDVDPAIAERLSEALLRVIATPEFAAFAESRGGAVEGGTRDEFADFISGELTNWQGVVAAAGMSVD